VTADEIKQANRFLEGRGPRDVLSWACERFGASRVGIASSLSAEDQVLAWAASGLDPRPVLFMLDTGRHFPETLDLVDATRERYGLRFEVLYPRAEDVEAMVAEHGMNLFYRSPELRRRCCQVRKVDVLVRRLATLSAWVTGQRRQQSVTRAALEVVEWDEAHGLVKLNPLAAWTVEEVWDHVREHDVPVNPLHARGFPSIGCAPCTRAVAPGEDVRAGRWWWEQPGQKECGLHVQGGRLVRAAGPVASGDGDGDAAVRAPGEG